MLILADENIDGALVHWLRSTGHDVLWMTEEGPGTADELVMARAEAEQRILLTSDLDFGQLVYRERRRCAGLILLRMRTTSVDHLIQRLVAAWPQFSETVHGHFVLVSNSRVRMRRLLDRD